MLKLNRSPIFWLVLGILWSLSLLVSVLEKGFVFHLAYIPIGLLAVLSYIMAIFMTFKRKSRKEDRHEKDR